MKLKKYPKNNFIESNIRGRQAGKDLQLGYDRYTFKICLSKVEYEILMYIKRITGCSMSDAIRHAVRDFNPENLMGLKTLERCKESYNKLNLFLENENDKM